MSLLHMIMIRILTLPIAPNIEINTTSAVRTCSVIVRYCLHFCSFSSSGYLLCFTYIHLWYLYYPVHTEVPLTPTNTLTSLQTMWTFRDPCHRISPYIMILTPTPHFLQLTVTMWRVVIQIHWGQFRQCFQYTYIYNSQIILSQVKRFQSTDFCKCFNWHWTYIAVWFMKVFQRMWNDERAVSWYLKVRIVW